MVCVNTRWSSGNKTSLHPLHLHLDMYTFYSKSLSTTVLLTCKWISIDSRWYVSCVWLVTDWWGISCEVKPVCSACYYAEAMERSPVGGGCDIFWGFCLSAKYFALLLLLLPFIKQPKVLVSNVSYRVVIMINICVNRRNKWLILLHPISVLMSMVFINLCILC